jgi:hypothetical protein
MKGIYYPTELWDAARGLGESVRHELNLPREE